jgi:pimeloyl-ACP methyl ester carboxylesterase
MTRALAGEVDVVPFFWLTQPGPWDVPSVAERVAGHLVENWSWPVIVCGHSTGGVIALHLAVRHPALVGGLVLVDTGAHMHGHGDVDAILERVKDVLTLPARFLLPAATAGRRRCRQLPCACHTRSARCARQRCHRDQ